MLRWKNEDQSPGQRPWQPRGPGGRLNEAPELRCCGRKNTRAVGKGQSHRTGDRSRTGGRRWDGSTEWSAVFRALLGTGGKRSAVNHWLNQSRGAASGTGRRCRNRGSDPPVAGRVQVPGRQGAPGPFMRRGCPVGAEGGALWFPRKGAEQGGRPPAALRPRAPVLGAPVSPRLARRLPGRPTGGQGHSGVRGGTVSSGTGPGPGGCGSHAGGGVNRPACAVLPSVRGQ